MFLFGGANKASPSDKDNNISGESPVDLTVNSNDDSKAPANNPLLDNLERTVFTFNMHNLTEMCFQHVVKRS